MDNRAPVCATKEESATDIQDTMCDILNDALETSQAIIDLLVGPEPCTCGEKTDLNCFLAKTRNNREVMDGVRNKIKRIRYLLFG